VKIRCMHCNSCWCAYLSFEEGIYIWVTGECHIPGMCMYRNNCDLSLSRVLTKITVNYILRNTFFSFRIVPSRSSIRVKASRQLRVVVYGLGTIKYLSFCFDQLSQLHRLVLIPGWKGSPIPFFVK
jgi:hypothetical protein